MHFHLCGDVQGRAYIKDCSIHHNYQRSITIHGTYLLAFISSFYLFSCFVVLGTHNLIVRRNVAYDTQGHSYFIEDGIETGNELSWNLGILATSVDNTEVKLDANGNVLGGILFSEYVFSSYSFSCILPIHLLLALSLRSFGSPILTILFAITLLLVRLLVSGEFNRNIHP